jgi:protein SCO1
MRRCFFFLTLAALLMAACAPKPTYNGSVIDPQLDMPDFTLQSADGPVTLSDYAGKFVALFFGYTRCADTCPTTMANLRYGVDGLGDKAGDVQVIFVSVDPQRDTPEEASQYAQVFYPDFIGVTGTKAEIVEVTSNFGIYSLLGSPDEQGDYEVEHTSSVLLLNPDRKLILTWPQGTTAEQIKQDMQTLVGN